MHCTAYCTAMAYDFKGLIDYLAEEYQPKIFNTMFYLPLIKFGTDAHICCFQYGVIVFWGLSKQQEQDFLQQFKQFEINSHSTPEIERHLFCYGENAKIFAGTIVLPDQDIFKKIAISHGLAQAVKLTTFEISIQQTISKTYQLPEKLAATGRIPLSRREISKLRGELFIVRSSVNLHTDILDTPEFFWNYDELEPFYKMTINNLDLVPRVEVLNKRLAVIHELFDMLGHSLEYRHTAFLEWIIITLITLEIVVSVGEFFLFYYHH